jgi:hypothetical protein
MGAHLIEPQDVEIVIKRGPALKFGLNSLRRYNP